MGPKEEEFPQWPFLNQIQLKNIGRKFPGLISCDKVNGHLDSHRQLFSGDHKVVSSFLSIPNPQEPKDEYSGKFGLWETFMPAQGSQKE